MPHTSSAAATASATAATASASAATASAPAATAAATTALGVGIGHHKAQCYHRGRAGENR